jgi:Flp pilus assembly protein TadG
MDGAHGPALRRQAGSAIVLVMVGLVAMLAMGALAFDIGHLTLSKARLQGVLDAAALGAAKTLYDQGATAAAKADATAAATEIIATHAATYRELASALSSGLNVAVEYSNTLSPFVDGTMPVNFVRVRAENFNMLSTLARVVGIDSITTRSSAVAGPQGTTTTTAGSACNILPVMMCADTAAGAPMWGYQPGQLVGMKNGANSNPAAAGPGNYYLIRLGGSGANVVRDNLAGAHEGCATMGGSLETEPGNEAGPTRQGINTRFNQYLGPMSSSEFPPDVVVSEPNPALKLDCPTGSQTGSCVVKQGNTVVTSTSQIGYSHSNDYVPRLPNGPYDVSPYPDGVGRFKRREVAVPIADCSGAPGGQQTLPVVGFACVFLIQKVQGTGQDANIIGEVISSCDSGGASGPPTGTPNPSLSYKIVLYDDVDSADS